MMQHGNGRNEILPATATAATNVTYFPTVWPQKIGLKTSFSKENLEFIFHLFFCASDNAIVTCLAGCVHINLYPSGRNRFCRSDPLGPSDRYYGTTTLGGSVCVTVTGITVSMEGKVTP